MPEYEFFCRRCRKPFSILMTLREHDEKQTECPECHKTDQVDRRISHVHTVTSKKS